MRLVQLLKTALFMAFSSAVLSEETMSACKIPKLMLVTCRAKAPLKHYLDFTEACVKAGVTGVQLREKNLEDQELIQMGYALKECLKPFDAWLIINDRVDICLKLQAHGVHLGQSDASVQEARQLLGERKLIGLSVNTFAQIERANSWSVDYIGLGAIFPTQSKTDVQTIWGLPGLAQAVERSQHPVIAIGGINEANGSLVMQAGAYGIAAIDAFHKAKSAPCGVVEKLSSLINQEL